MNESRAQINAKAPHFAEATIERREAERFSLDMKVSISTEGHGGGLTVSPATVQDMSRTGVWVSLRQHIPPLQSVQLAIPTSLCPKDMQMPETFVGPATVVRLEHSDDGASRLGLRLGDSFYRNMEFALFMEYLQSRGQMGPILSETD